MSVMYLSARIRFNWDEVDFSIFSTFTMATGFIGELIFVLYDCYTTTVDNITINLKCDKINTIQNVF